MPPPVLASESLRVSLGWTLTVLAWVAVCWVATARQARGGRPWLPAVVGGAAARRALLAVGVPALALWLGAVAVLVTSDTYGWGAAEAALLPAAVVEPGGSLLLLVVAAALISGAGRIGALALVVAQVATTAPLISMWSGGGSDLLLLGCVLSAGATACAASWRPVARALADLAADAPGTTAAPRPLVS